MRNLSGGWRRRGACSLIIALAMVGVLSPLVLLSASATSPLPATLGPQTISTAISYQGGSADLVGDVTIGNGGSLTITGGILEAAAGSGGVTLLVESGGSLVLEGTTIAPATPGQWWELKVDGGASLLVDQSTLQGAGDQNLSDGLVLGGDEMTISGSTLQDNIALALEEGSLTVTQTVISGHHHAGIRAQPGTGLVLSESTIEQTTQGSGLLLLGATANVEGSLMAAALYWGPSPPLKATGPSHPRSAIMLPLAPCSAPALVPIIL